MDGLDRLSSPPPSYPDSVISEYSSSSEGGHARRYSTSSAVLPPDHGQRLSASTSSGKRGLVLQHIDPAHAQRSPESYMNRTRSATTSTRSVDRRTSFSYMSITEADDPAVIAHAFPPPPASQYPYQNNRPSPISPSTSRSSHLSPLVHSPTLPPLPEVNLRPPYTCVFRDTEPFCMTLGPADHAPLYRIDVRPSCFMPTSYITTVSRGAGGELVARFEMGLSRDRPMLYMDQRTMPLDEVFVNYRKVDSKLRGRWKWIRAGYTLQWDWRNDFEALCFHDADKEKTPLARLFPASSVLLTPHAAQPPVTKLEVRTPYVDLLDEIVISALIVERKRQTPSEGSQNKELFN